jgi:uncharacterized protein with HEPN domain
MNESSKPQLLRDRLRAVVANRFKRSEKVLSAIQIGFILVGGFAAGVSQIMPDTNLEQVPWREILGYGGSILVLIGGALLWYLQYNSLEELKTAWEAESQLRDKEDAFRGRIQALSNEFQKVKQNDDQRAKLAEAISRAISIVDEVIAEDTKDLRTDVEKILTACLLSLLTGLGLSMSDNYCISVFKREMKDDKEQMVRFAERRSGAPEKPIDESRSWLKGSGFTGHAWLQYKPLFVDDSELSHWHDIIANVTDEDTRVYRSVASVLIRPGKDEGEPWGAMTVTTMLWPEGQWPRRSSRRCRQYSL